MSNIDVMSANAIRILAADSIQKANSGHPGLPLGCADIAYQLFTKVMNHSPKNPKWPNRDRFILSGGHGSTLLYSLLHLFDYGLSIDDLKQFRQVNSLTPGHPEYGHTEGVEATTGPLGAGMAMAVGMAIAEKHLSAKFNEEGYSIIDHYTYVLGGDGCLMEGISHEAFSLAGTLGLSKLIVLYDSNKITIEGSTDLAYTEDVKKRFESYGFQTFVVEDGHNMDDILTALQEAKADQKRPSIIIFKTKIGYGCPEKEGKASAHGEPLGTDNVKALREVLKWPSEEPFYVPEEVYTHFKNVSVDKSAKEEEWSTLFEAYCAKFPEKKKAWDEIFSLDIAKILLEDESFWSYEEKADATRNISGIALNRIKDVVPALLGGSADLAPSNKTYMKEAGDFSKENPLGRNFHFGVREIGMTAIGNGILLYGLRSYVATFFVFSDYAKPMARLASLMKIPAIFVLTHDSIGVGEDGPTHEPIEHMAMFRSLPNFHVFRPADATETFAAWYSAITSSKTPTALVLTRQNVPCLKQTSKEALKGGYIVADSEKEQPDAIILATGSELYLALEAKEELKRENIDVRVVSMPCMEIFEEQSEEYKEKVIPKKVRARVAVEALSEFGWHRYVGLDGVCVGMKGFGASGPQQELFELFGFTKERVVEAVKKVLL